MHLPPALLASLRACLGTTALLVPACDPSAAIPEPAPATGVTAAVPDAVPERAAVRVEAPTIAAPSATPPTATALDEGAAIETAAPRSRLRDRTTTTALAFTGTPDAVTRDPSTSFVAAESKPRARPKHRRPAPTPTWSCGPCGRG